MRTIKQVSDLTGVSVRMLHYYDQIGLLRPTKTTAAGYRLYDDAALETVQQILFFKELQVPLKEMKQILDSPNYDKLQTLQRQKKLLCLRRRRLDELIALIDKKMKGGHNMSFKEFDLSEYFAMLQAFKTEHEDQVCQYYGSVQAFDEMIEKMRGKEVSIARNAMKEFGSIEKYTQTIKQNLDHLPQMMQGFEEIKQNKDEYLARSEAQMQRLTADLTRDPAGPEVQAVMREIDTSTRQDHERMQMIFAENHWVFLSEWYLTRPTLQEKIDEKYGKGAAVFIGKAMQAFAEAQRAEA